MTFPIRAACGCAVLLAGSLMAQRSDTIRANVRGGGGDGKCTFEVVVDGIAEVEIRGDMGRIRTLSGNPAYWRRLDCNQTMPRYPNEFRFQGIDGRGRQELVRDPGSNRGVAVVRIEDPKSGEEGYTGDVMWRGGSGGPASGGWGNDRGSGWGNDRNASGNARGGWGNDRSDRRNWGSGSESNRRIDFDRAVDLCRDEVRARVDRDYGARDLDFRRIEADNNPGRNDWIVGEAVARRGGRRDEFSFACSVDFNNGRVRSAEVRRR